MSEVAPAPKPPHWGKRLFLGFLGSVACLYAVIVTYHLSVPMPLAGATPSWMEKCRELCLKYNLVPSGNIARDAEDYLAAAKSQDLTAPLSQILADKDFTRAETENHSLLGQVPPDFTLPNSKGELVSLRDLTAQGPVVLVFYYGYNCSHCVAQLFGLQKDLPYLKELEAQVVALSADSPEKTAESFDKYGGFDFPVLADKDNKVATLYEVFTPAHGDQEEDLKHGTFIIDQSGKLVFVNRGYQPFIDNKSILFWLASKNPSPKTAEPQDLNLK